MYYEAIYQNAIFIKPALQHPIQVRVTSPFSLVMELDGIRSFICDPTINASLASPQTYDDNKIDSEHSPQSTVLCMREPNPLTPLTALKHDLTRLLRSVFHIIYLDIQSTLLSVDMYNAILWIYLLPQTLIK